MIKTGSTARHHHDHLLRDHPSCRCVYLDYLAPYSMLDVKYAYSFRHMNLSRQTCVYAL